ncbi:MAG TPA: type II secretion system protein GspG [Treponema sp.]|nr:type II secretion system protein GspG [Treponema sp.]
MYKKQIEKNEDGWSFMETLIVIAVVLVLTAAVGFMAIGSLQKARRASAQSQIDSFCVALEAYFIDCGQYPTVEQGLSALRKKPSVEPVSDNWGGPYLYKEPPKDPWGSEYEYTVPGPDGNSYGIRSFGADGKEGGTDENTDITSW